MKKLITICLIIAATFTVKAQDGKPTKERTINFIQSALNESIGSKYYGKVIEKNVFTHDMLNKCIVDGSSNKIDTYYNINWELYTGCAARGDNGIVKIDVYMSNPVKNIATSTKIGEEEPYYSVTNYDDQIHFFAPYNKVESLKKAFARLAEIAKEENKDPFKN